MGPLQGRALKSSNGDGFPREVTIRAKLQKSSVVSTLNRRSCAVWNLVQSVFLSGRLDFPPESRAPPSQQPSPDDQGEQILEQQESWGP